MTKQLLYFLLLCITTYSFSQTNRVNFYGYVKDSIGTVKDAHVINLNTKMGTSTNDFGSFRIPVFINDTLQITSLKYHTVFYKITKKRFLKKSGTIQLYNKTYILEEVSIKRHNLDGTLSTDLKKTPLNKNEELVDKMVKGIKNLKYKDIINIPIGKDEVHLTKVSAPSLPNSFVGAGGSVSIPDYNLIAKRKLRRNITFKERFPKLLLSDFSPEFFFKELKIPKNKYYHFLEYCNPLNIEQLYKDKKVFEVIKILRRESKTYLEIIKKE